MEDYMDFNWDAEPEAEAAREAFVVDDDHKADWALREIRKQRAETQRLNNVRQSQIDELKAAMAREEARCEKATMYLESLLKGYFDSVPHKATKTQQTYALPSGRLVLKMPAQKLDHDDARIAAWFAAQDAELRRRYVADVPKVQWAELKKNLTVTGNGVFLNDTGEEIPGVVATMSEPRFEISL